MLPAGWQSALVGAGPSAGANLNVIFADRHLVQDADGRPAPGQATNLLAVVAVPAHDPATGARGVMILSGFSAAPEGVPGPYGVFVSAQMSVERNFQSEGAAIRGTERRTLASPTGDLLTLRLQFTRGVPVRSNTETRAYSAKDPSFYRIYHADQGAELLWSGTANAGGDSEPHYEADGPLLGPLLRGAARLASVTSVPWTVRRAFLPPHAAVLRRQARDPAAFTKPYSTRGRTSWIDSPISPRENGILSDGATVWLDADPPDGSRGMCRIRLADGRLAYVVDVAGLRKGESRS